MKTQKSKKVDFMTLKLDMSKAYDRVEWRFLIEIMKKMGFCDAWVNLIYECISTVSYSILVNGEPKGEISLTRGIRQGDPLSPYLFLLCSEGLNRLIQHAARDNVIRGFSLCKNGPKITNLFFADDTLLFCRARMEELQAIQHILSLYEGASGQQINREKTTLFFSKAVPEETKRDIISFLGVPEIKEYEKYLGLPTVVGRNKRASLTYIKERVWAKLQGWKEKLLSQAGREILLKAVVQAIPTFAMSCFKLPVGLCKEIEMQIRKFWWGERGSQRKIHWKSWEVLCKPKKEGGMGFKDLVRFNEAMLAKQIWRLQTDRNSLLFKVFSTKYFPTGSVLEAKSKKGSYAWQSILKARHVIEKGMLWRVGDGSQIRVFEDSWIPGYLPTKAVPCTLECKDDSMVSSLINQTTMEWNGQLIDQKISPYLAQRIKAIPLCRMPQEDCTVWPRNRDGNYSVKIGYQLLGELENREVASGSNTDDSRKFWKWMWSLKIPNKIKHFGWRACTESLPTMANLHRQKVLQSSLCSNCNGKRSNMLFGTVIRC